MKVAVTVVRANSSGNTIIGTQLYPEEKSVNGVAKN